jgi:DNA-binding transcriptional regulator YiaG
VPKIEAAVKEAVLRGARREIRLATQPLRREMRRLRLHVKEMRNDIRSLSVVASQWRVTQGDGWKPEVTERELKVARVSASLIRKLRGRLRLSQSAFARLLKVTAAAVIGWESGRFKPSDSNRKGIVALRRLGRRDVKRLLGSLPTPPVKRRTKRIRRRARKMRAAIKRSRSQGRRTRHK